MNLLKDLQHLANKFSILYVEDNKALRDKAKILLDKFFKNVDLASNGEEGLALFKQNHYHIVLSDIKMPNMDGLTLSKHIKELLPETKIIIMSAFDDKELLLQGIEIGIFRFLIKPINIPNLLDVLYKAILEVEHENHTKIFYNNLKNIFDYQSSMIVMLYEKNLILANDIFLKFFNIKCVKKSKYSLLDITNRFLIHGGFLYNHADIDVVDTLFSNPQKPFHIKIKSRDNNFRHFILKYQKIPNKLNYGTLSFDDVTDLNLLESFSIKQSNNDEKVLNQTTMYPLLKLLQRNTVKVDIHNYYNGLSVTNISTIEEIQKDSITIKTNYIQLKAMQLEQQTYIYSSTLPYVIKVEKIEIINFEKQEVKLKSLFFVQTSPIQRNNVRVVPTDTYRISLYVGKDKFNGDIKIEDISLNSVKLQLSSLPAGLDLESNAVLDIVLQLNKKPLNIHTKVKMLKKSESKHSFHVVFIFKDFQEALLTQYIIKRQRELIRDLKGI